MSSDCRRRWQRPSRSGGSPDGPESRERAVVKWSLNSREISEPRSLLPLARSVPPLSVSPLAATAQRNDFWLRWAHLVGPARGGRRRRRRPAGGHSINDNLLASSSHCQLALNYDIIDPNLTSGGGSGGNGLTTAGGERRVCLFSLPARARPSGQVFFGPSPSSAVVVVGSIIIIIYPHSLCIGTTPDRSGRKGVGRWRGSAERTSANDPMRSDTARRSSEEKSVDRRSLRVC